jgi:hypothetical protein
VELLCSSKARNENEGRARRHGFGSAGESTNSVEVSARPASFVPVQLSFAAAGSELQLDWPEDQTGWQLQAQTNSLSVGLGTNWSNIAGSAQTNQITLPLSATDSVADSHALGANLRWC